MPLTPSARSCPFLLPSDRLSLSPFVRTTQKNALQDVTLGASHTLHGAGSQLIEELSVSTTYRNLVQTAARLQISESDLRVVLGFLNHIGGLCRRRAFKHGVQALYMAGSHALLGVFYTPLSLRTNTSLVKLLWASLRATTPVLLAIGVVAATAWCARIMNFQAMATAVVSSQLLFATSIAVHEYAHVLVLRYFNIRTAILQSGMHLGVIHPATLPHIEICSAIAGPLLGMGYSLLAGALLWQLGYNWPAIGGLAVSLLHLYSLLPLYGDGASLIKAIRERKNT